MAKNLTVDIKAQNKELKRKLKESQAYIKELEKTAKQGAKGMNNSFNGAKRSLSDFRAECNNAKGSMASLLGNLKSGNILGVGDSIKQLTSGISKLGAAGAAAAIGVAALAAAVAASVKIYAEGNKVAMEFNSQQSKLQAITGKSAQEISELRKQAMELGAATSFSASQIAGLQIELAKLGFSVENIKNMTSSVQLLAKATGADLSQAAALAGSTLRMFNMDSAESGRVADVLSKACSSSALSFDFLNSAMSTIGPVANAFGFALEDTVSLLGMLANAGFDASSAATATRNILLNLADSNGKLAQSLGHTVTNGTELLTALIELRDKGIDLATALELTDKRSVAAFNTFLNGAESGQELLTTLEQCDGAAQDMAKTMGDNLQGDITSLKSAWEGLMLQLFSDQSILRDLVQGLTEIVRTITKVIGAVQNLYNKTENVRNFFYTIWKTVMIACNPIIKLIGLLKEAASWINKVFGGNNNSGGNKIKAVEMTDEKDKEGTARLNRLMEQETKRNNRKGGSKSGGGKSGGGKSGGRTSTVTPKVEPIIPQGSIKYIEEQLSKKRVEFSLATSTESRRKIQKEINDLLSQKQTMEIQAKFDFGEAGTKGANISDLMKKQFTDIDYNSIQQEASTKMGAVVDKINEEQIRKWQEAEDKKAKIKELQQQTLDSMINAAHSAADAFEMPEFDILGTVAQAVANVAMGYSQAVALAGNGSAGGPWGWIAFAAAGLVEMLAVVASIKSATSGFANGGIIGGSMMHGDNMLARVNSGEMILNGNQQSNLFNMINDGNNGVFGGNVHFVLRGADLYGSMKNFSKTKSLVGKNTGIK